MKKKTQSELQKIVIDHEAKKENDIEQLSRYCSEPTRKFNENDKVVIGNLKDAVIIKSFNGGKVYEVEYDFQHINNRDVSRLRRCFAWHDIFRENKTTESLFKEDNFRLTFSSTSLENIMSKKYYFGLDLDPDYQRGYVWYPGDEEALIESIFNNDDIGKFVFLNKDVDEGYLYEIIDGKQRVNAILRFFEGRFHCRGRLYSDLSPLDRMKFRSFNVSMAVVSNASKKEIYQYFLKLNKTGKVMDNEHLEKVEALLWDLNNSIH